MAQLDVRVQRLIKQPNQQQRHENNFGYNECKY